MRTKYEVFTLIRSKDIQGVPKSPYYAALLPRSGPHIASHSVCPSVRLSVRPSRYRYRASRRAT